MNLVENFVQGILFLPVLICKGVTPKTRKKKPTETISDT